MTPIDVDLAIVGAGPTGLYGAYYAGVRGLTVAVIDSLPEVGGQITAMYPEKPIYDVAGFPAVLGRELVDGLRKQADRYHPIYLLDQRAEHLQPVHDPTGHRFQVTTSANTEIRARAVVLTCGIGTFKPRPLPAGDGHLGRGLTYFVRNLSEMIDTDVVVVGGGDSACDWALALEGSARSVTLVHRRDTFRAHSATVTALRNSSIEVLTNAQVTGISGIHCVEQVEVVQGSVSHIRPAQRVIAALGFTADLGPVRSWSVDLWDNRHVVVDTRMQTSADGIYAAGDLTEYPGKVRLISVGFGEVATAVNNAAASIDPAATVFPGHSTDQDPATTEPQRVNV
ncbi:NAD(P)/FAD-dependent oxidoreductase [Rhodococcus oxybenzonivorans]|uniref:NAD(P)/FAD-dependent oxidoreductase n=1 Tax=Rhodococcus oxybenzonivorans TaxID=1990687 RepID=UPI002955AA93|nr:NAD(P)/FAD-dependent oxidoreductase [Rhodococcus oxybenzonivorans]MDV7357633.1 NAD(P)/FAD-dependent oxidoreductase [Rhodococcus oxybenzonivorans]